MRLRAFIALAVMLAACGGNAGSADEGVASLDEDSESTVTTEARMDAEAAAIAFTECMRENGVEMEDPTVDAEGNVIPGRPTDLPEFEEGGGAVQIEPDDELSAAFEECAEFLEGTSFGFTPEDQTALEDQLLALAECLRDQGLEVADPDLSGGPDIQADEGGGGVRATGPFGLDFEDPEVQAAMEQCEEFAPNFGGGPDGGGFALNGTPPGGAGDDQ